MLSLALFNGLKITFFYLKVNKKVKQLFYDKKIVVAFPPARFSFALEKIAHASFVIGRKKIADSLFPDEVVKADGYALKRPDE